jgi:hypothetical protein
MLWTWNLSTASLKKVFEPVKSITVLAGIIKLPPKSLFPVFWYAGFCFDSCGFASRFFVLEKTDAKNCQPLPPETEIVLVWDAKN